MFPAALLGEGALYGNLRDYRLLYIGLKKIEIELKVAVILGKRSNWVILGRKLILLTQRTKLLLGVTCLYSETPPLWKTYK